jgi:hypothetical protein
MPDSIEVIQEKTRGLEGSVRELKDGVRDLERRVREIEMEKIEELRRKLLALEGRASSFESAHDDNKEKWSMALNFVVQLMWVVTASFVLTKLGFNMGPL